MKAILIIGDMQMGAMRHLICDRMFIISNKKDSAEASNMAQWVKALSLMG